MVQKTVLKVDISCMKCKKKLLKSVSSLQGVDKIEVDSVKGTLTVTGDADPYEIVQRTKKVSRFVEVVTIGPPPAPPKQDGQKKPDEKKPEEKKPAQVATHIHTPHNCPMCQRMDIVYVNRYDEPNTACSIM